MKFSRIEISRIENYFNSKINQRKLCSGKLSKYVTAFNYIGKMLIILSAITGEACIDSHTTVVGAPVGIASAVFTIAFFLATGILKKLLTATRKKKKKYDKILMLAKIKLNSIESLVSQALNDMELSSKEFITLLKEKDKHEKMKGNVSNMSEKLEERPDNVRLNSVNLRS